MNGNSTNGKVSSGCWGLDWIYLVFMLIFGSLLAFVTPRYQIADEMAHFARVYQTSEMVLVCPAVTDSDGQRHLAASVPSVFYPEKYKQGQFKREKGYCTWQDVKDFLAEPLDPDARVEQGVGNMAAYSPLVYAPQAVTGGLVRLLGGSAGAVYYAMRLGAVLFVALCVFFAIRLFPEKGLLTFSLAVMPMFLTESASVAADAVVFGCSFLISAYLFSLARERTEFRTRELSLLLLAAIVLGLLKQVYGTILLLYFLIPWQRMRTKGRYVLFGLILMAVCLATSLLWLYVSMVRQNVISDNGQLALLRGDPLNYLVVLGKTIRAKSGFYLASFIGILGWLTLPMPYWFYFLYLAVLIVAGLSGRCPVPFGLGKRLVILVGCAATWLAIMAFLYLTYTAPGAAVVEGVQGRYFIPIALMFFTVFSCRARLKHERTAACLIALLSVFMTLSRTIQYFY